MKTTIDINNKTLDIRNVPKDEIHLSWLTKIVDQFDEVIMTKEQLDDISLGTMWKTIKGKKIKLKL
jgi:hypothetical protein